MKRITLSLVLVLVGCGVGFAQRAKPATAQEKKDILQLVLKDKDVAEALPDMDGGEKELAKSLSVEQKDLNKDGRPEYVATLENGFLCGAHANCPHWVFAKKGDGYQLLLATSGQTLKAQTTASNKFLDLRADGADSAFETSYSIYKFDGSTYKAADCFTINHEKKKPKTTRIKCEQ